MGIEAFNLSSVSTPKKDTDRGERKEYVSAGAYRCKVTGIVTSDNINNYSGSPFVSFEVVTETGKHGRCRFWAIKETDAPKTKEWKAKSLKDFLVNCGVSNFSTDSDAIKSATGNWVNVVFTYEEYITKDKNTNEPKKGRMIRYRWSSKDGEEITYNPKYNKPLNPEDEAQFKKLLDEYHGDSTSQEEDAF